MSTKRTRRIPFRRAADKSKDIEKVMEQMDNIAAASQVIEDVAFTVDVEALPELEPGQFDLLTDERIDALVASIANERVGVEVAAMSVGIPIGTLIEYVETGEADLAAGFPTRKAILAKAVMAARAAMIKARLKAIDAMPVAWQREAWALERMEPNLFSEKRNTKTETKQSAAMEALQRQLAGAMNSTPLPLPKPASP